MSRRPISTLIARDDLALNRGAPGARMWSESPINQHWSRIGSAGEESSQSSSENCVTYPPPYSGTPPGNYLRIYPLPESVPFTIYFTIEESASSVTTLLYAQDSYQEISPATFVNGEWVAQFGVWPVSMADFTADPNDPFSGNDSYTLTNVRVCSQPPSEPSKYGDLHLVNQYGGQAAHISYGDWVWLTEFTNISGSDGFVYEQEIGPVYITLTLPASIPDTGDVVLKRSKLDASYNSTVMQTYTFPGPHTPNSTVKIGPVSLIWGYYQALTDPSKARVEAWANAWNRSAIIGSLLK